MTLALPIRATRGEKKNVEVDEGGKARRRERGREGARERKEATKESTRETIVYEARGV